MENLKQAKTIINKVINYDDKLLERTTGLSETLLTFLEKHLPEGLIEDIRQIDSLTTPKKRALLDYLLKIIEQLLEKSQNKTTSTQKTVKSLSLKDFFQIKLQETKILKPIEKKAFRKIGADSIYDALFFMPRRYEDRRLKKLAKIKDGETGLFEVEVVEVKKIKRGKLKTQVVLKQGNRLLSAYFVHDKPFLFSFFRKGKKVLLYGKISRFGKEVSIIQPEIYNTFDSIIMDRIVPVYSLRGDSGVKITSQTINHLRRGIYKILKKYLPYLPEFMPKEILSRYKLPEIKTAVEKTHFPPEEENLEVLNGFESRPQLRLIFDELFILELAQSYRKAIIQKNPAEPIRTPADFIKVFQKYLPFQLTQDQKKALNDILSDISRPIPMNRMIQGDVGSGKTVVAVGASLAVALDGKQVAVMAPTEILAQQHYRNFQSIFSKFSIPVYLLTGSTPQKEKREIYKKIESGEAPVVIGTHALIQDEVRFKKLSLVIVDEQHRFGVEQRKALIEKSGKMPHVLVMTATPIPRTLTLALFGDLDVSIIKQMPAGRKPVKTVLYYDDERDMMIEKIRKELDSGRQAFVVYPLIEESEKMELKSAEEGYKAWSEYFPDKKILLLHGRMSQEEKEGVMEKFRAGEGDILVSTTVIEVGVDIPNATIMVVEDAYRFGLSQIHQLRGRVGRGQYGGYCFLVVPSKFKHKSDNIEEEKRRLKTLERLKILVKTSDGFKIAEADLELRGGGDIIGTAQSGRFNFSIADLTRPKDRIILEYAKKEAENLIKEDPSLEGHPYLKELMFRKYGDRFSLVNIA